MEKTAWIKKIAALKLAKFYLAGISLIVSILICEILLRINHYYPNNEAAGLEANWKLTDKKQACLMPLSFPKIQDFCDNSKQQIITVGDSFTKGYPLTLNDSYPSQLQKLLNQNSNFYCVVNYGQSNTGTDQQLRIFEDLILPASNPSIVIWSLYPNDIWDNIQFPMYQLDEKNQKLLPQACWQNYSYLNLKILEAAFPKIIKQHSYVYNLIFEVLKLLLKFQIPNIYQKDPGIYGALKLKLGINRIIELSKIHNFKLYFLVIAPQSQYLDKNLVVKDWTNTSYRKIKHILVDNQHQNFIIDASFLNNPKDDATLNKIIFSEESEDSTPLGDKHFNKVGYGYLAKIIYDRMVQDNLTAK